MGIDYCSYVWRTYLVAKQRSISTNFYNLMDIVIEYMIFFTLSTSNEYCFKRETLNQRFNSSNFKTISGNAIEDMINLHFIPVTSIAPKRDF